MASSSQRMTRMLQLGRGKSERRDMIKTQREILPYRQPTALA